LQQVRAVTQTLGLSSQDTSVVPDIVAAFQRTCETQLHAVYAYVRYRVSSADVAEELTAKTFLRALERLETFDPAKGELTPWLFGVARHMVKDYLRARRRWTWIPIDWIVQRECRDPNPEAAMAAGELHQHLAHGLTCLSGRDRDVLGLKFGAGFTNRDISRITGLREAHVGVIVYRAVGRLRRQLAAKGFDHE
jgi:RNA polymerase sigma factor (sigma-70 family)